MVRALRRIVLAAAISAAAPPCPADPGHEILIEDLNRQITENPGLPDLYYQRSVNYREINRLADARADLEKCLTIQPEFLPANRELARLDEAEGHRAEGIVRLEKAVAAAPSAAAFHLPGCYAVLADFYLKAERNNEALEAAGRGIALSKQMTLDLYLFRAEAQRRLGKHEERIRDLASAVETLKSFVLRIAWIEALIDGGHRADALAEIDREIESNRYRASWLIRRARVLLQSGNAEDRTAADADLESALAEVESRIRPERPDLSLVCDRALIMALQGKREAAAAELASAKSRGADPWMTRVLDSVLQRPAP